MAETDFELSEGGQENPLDLQKPSQDSPAPINVAENGRSPSPKEEIVASDVSGAPTELLQQQQQDLAPAEEARPAVSLQELQQLMAIQAQLVGLQAAAAGQMGAVVQQQPPPLVSQQTVTAVPQLILAGGQMAQGIQGAQLIVPTSHGLTMQPIITIPANQVAGGGLAQLCLNGGHVFAATAANLQALVAPSIAPSVTNVSQAAAPVPALAALHAPMAAPLTFAAALNGTANAARSSAPNGSAQQYAPASPQYTYQPAPYQAQYAAARQYCTAAVQQAGTGAVQRTTADDACSVDSGDSQDPFRDTGNQPTINQATTNVVDGINLEEVKEFARAFKMRRLSLGLTQTQVGQALSVSMGPAYSQSAICRFEKLDITPKSAQKIKPILEKWMREAEERYRHKLGTQNLVEFCGQEPSKKRKRRTSFSPQALEALNAHFERNTHPSGQEITQLAARLGYEREVVRIWFCNKRQALKNTVRLMGKTSNISSVAGTNGSFLTLTASTANGYHPIAAQKPPMKAV